MEKRINGAMIVMSLIGGAIGFVAGEFLLQAYQYTLPHSVLMGAYFGILALCIGTLCLFAEIIQPRLNGFGWKNHYVKTSFKFLVPSTLILLFLLGMFFQFIYELNLGKEKKINDVVFVIDTSGSMKETDPNQERFGATIHLLDSMNKENRVAIYAFDETAKQLLPMTPVTEEGKVKAKEKLQSVSTAGGNTNMGKALEEAYREIQVTAQKDRNAMIILLSDGGDTYDLENQFEEKIKPFQEKEIPIYTIGMSKENHFKMLKNLARESGGNYYNVGEVKELRGVFNKIYVERQQRLLMDKRNGSAEFSKLYQFLRIFFLTLLGGALAFSVSLVFDNKNLWKSFLFRGLLSGLFAGIWLEIGFSVFPWAGTFLRAIADLIMAVLFTLFPVRVEVKEYKKHAFLGGHRERKQRNANENHTFQ